MGKLVLEGNPDIDEFYYYNDKMKLRDFYKIARSMRQKKFDVVIDFMNNPRSALFTWFTGATQRIAYQSVRRAAYTEIVPRISVGEYIVREKLRLLEPLDVTEKSIQLVLPVQEHHHAAALKFFSMHQNMKLPRIRVILSPTHRRSSRQWPLIRFAELSDRLVREWGANVIWLWGPGEEEFVKAGLHLISERAVLAPKTSFREMAALIERCDLFIGNSNGPSHVAVAVDTCSFQLHGPTSLRSWCPLTDRHRGLEAKDHTTPDGLANISSNEVWTEVMKMHSMIEDEARSRRQEEEGS